MAKVMVISVLLCCVLCGFNVEKTDHIKTPQTSACWQADQVVNDTPSQLVVTYWCDNRWGGIVDLDPNQTLNIAYDGSAYATECPDSSQSITRPDPTSVNTPLMSGDPICLECKPSQIAICATKTQVTLPTQRPQLGLRKGESPPVPASPVSKEERKRTVTQMKEFKEKASQGNVSRVLLQQIAEFYRFGAGDETTPGHPSLVQNNCRQFVLSLYEEMFILQKPHLSTEVSTELRGQLLEFLGKEKEDLPLEYQRQWLRYLCGQILPNDHAEIIRIINESAQTKFWFVVFDCMETTELSDGEQLITKGDKAIVISEQLLVQQCAFAEANNIGSQGTPVGHGIDGKIYPMIYAYWSLEFDKDNKPQTVIQFALEPTIAVLKDGKVETRSSK